MGEQNLQESKKMWSFKKKRYVNADEYFEIDGDCRLEIPSLAHCPSEEASLYPDAFAGSNDEDLLPTTPYHEQQPAAD